MCIFQVSLLIGTLHIFKAIGNYNNVEYGRIFIIQTLCYTSIQLYTQHICLFN